MRNLAVLVKIDSHMSVCQDENDNRVLECAIDGNADCIITGDSHLLQLGSFQKISIITVSDFLDYFKKDR